MHGLRRKTFLGKTLPSALFLTDAGRIPDPLAVIETLPEGSGVIVRDYRAAEREGLARTLLAACRARGLFCLVGADWRLALALGADGVHLPRWAQASPLLMPRPRRFLVTAAVHSRPELTRAEALKPDALLISPVFPTKGIAEGETLGLNGFLKLARAAQAPCYALGGLTRENARQLPAHPRFLGVAGISIFAKKA
ncbi:MAG TPA: thiamine phosphate synthase [Sphingomonadales bacterium]|nr:thiamine phosphate synthase [Sphingomonadales bacterium]